MYALGQVSSAGINLLRWRRVQAMMTKLNTNGNFLNYGGSSDVDIGDRSSFLTLDLSTGHCFFNPKDGRHSIGGR
jgi:hypothetical protein